MTVTVNGTTGITAPDVTATTINGTTVNFDGTPVGRLYLETSFATTSGAFVDTPPIPSWAKRVTIVPIGVSTTGANGFRIQCYDNSVLVTTGYQCTSAYIASGSNVASWTDRIFDTGSSANTLSSGGITFLTAGSNKWAQHGIITRFNDGAVQLSSGTVSLGTVLTGFRISANSSDTFDAGLINLIIEG